MLLVPSVLVKNVATVQWTWTREWVMEDGEVVHNPKARRRIPRKRMREWGKAVLKSSGISEEVELSRC